MKLMSYPNSLFFAPLQHIRACNVRRCSALLWNDNVLLLFVRDVRSFGLLVKSSQ